MNKPVSATPTKLAASTRVVLGPRTRFSYCNIWEPRSINGGNPKYSMSAIMAAYIAAGNNSFTIYNPYPSASSQGYSYNYLQWSSVIITITYEEAVSQPTVSSSSVNLGSAVTIYTNRQSTATTHTLLYSFGSTSGTIASNVGASVSWTPPLSLASQIPSATSGICTITCQSYNGGTLTGTRTCTVTLNVPSTVVPSISSVTVEDTNTTVVSRIAAFVKGLSTLSVAITAAGVYGSTISSYRTSLDGVNYTAASFTASKKLSAAGDMTMTVTVTDSRGRTATYTTTFNVLDYSPPSITAFSAERCNSDGSAAQLDGTKARYSFAGKVTALNNKNGLSCVVYYKLKTATAWTTAEQMAITSYTLSATNKLLSQTFDALYSYDLKVRLTDYFYYVEQAVSIGTKGVILDFMADGTGIGIGKVAETSGYIDCGWPLKLSSALAVAYGGTGATSAASAIANLGGVKKTGDTMMGNLNISGYLYPSLLLLPTYNDTTNRTVFEGSYAGASSLPRGRTARATTAGCWKSARRLIRTAWTGLCSCGSVTRVPGVTTVCSIPAWSPVCPWPMAARVRPPLQTPGATLAQTTRQISPQAHFRRRDCRSSTPMAPRPSTVPALPMWITRLRASHQLPWFW